MELANIETLLEKYLDANTTLQEEDILKKYFNSGNVAPHLEEYGMMFDYFKESIEETFTKTIQLKPKKKTQKNWKWFSMVASVALLISVFIGKQQYDKHQQRKQFSEIKKALQQVSFNLNRGNNAIYTVSDNLTKGSDAITKLDTYQKTVKTVIDKINY